MFIINSIFFICFDNIMLEEKNRGNYAPVMNKNTKSMEFEIDEKASILLKTIMFNSYGSLKSFVIVQKFYFVNLP